MCSCCGPVARLAQGCREEAEKRSHSEGKIDDQMLKITLTEQLHGPKVGGASVCYSQSSQRDELQQGRTDSQSDD